MSGFSNGFIFNTDIYWRSSYRISPFNTSYNSINRQILDEGHVCHEVLTDFFGKNFVITQNGRSAICTALQYYNLNPLDEILIVTTSGSKYISGCVTNEIEKVCKWTLSMNEKVKLIFLNHEFGYCYENYDQIMRYKLPVIEDLALSFASKDESGKAGKIGDFVIYSIPKFFPIPFGGILKSNKEAALVNKDDDKELGYYLQVLLSHYLPLSGEFKLCRIRNLQRLSERFSEFGFSAYFDMLGDNIPGVFLFTAKGIDLSSYKIFMQRNGIESSIFYGQDAYYLPVHQNLNDDDLDFFYYLTKYFIENGG